MYLQATPVYKEFRNCGVTLNDNKDDINLINRIIYIKQYLQV